MRSFVLKGVSVITAVIISGSSVYAECRCTCKPDPPGGTTVCDSGIAVCGKSSGQGCEGRCVPATGTTSLKVAASALAGVLGIAVSDDDLRRDAGPARRAISSLLSSNSTDEVTVTFDGNSRTGTFGVSGDVATSLRDALNELESGVVVSNDVPGPPKAMPANPEQLRHEAEKYRLELERKRRTREIDIDTYKEDMDTYKEKIEEYKDAIRQKNQEPPDTTDS